MSWRCNGLCTRVVIVVALLRMNLAARCSPAWIHANHLFCFPMLDPLSLVSFPIDFIVYFFLSKGTLNEASMDFPTPRQQKTIFPPLRSRCPEAAGILGRCERLLPALRGQKVLGTWTGLRPARRAEAGGWKSGAAGVVVFPVTQPVVLYRAVVVKAVVGSHFGVGEFSTHFRTYFSFHWDVHWGYGLLTHGNIIHLNISPQMDISGGFYLEKVLCFQLPNWLIF